MSDTQSSDLAFWYEQAAYRIANGEYEAARCFIDAIANQAGDAPPQLVCLRGQLAAEIEGFAVGVQLLEQAIDQFRLAGDAAGEVITAGNLAAILLRTGELGRAYTLITWALKHKRDDDSTQHIRLFNIAAIVAMLQGRLDQGLALLETARNGVPDTLIVPTALNMAAALGALGQKDLAQSALDQAVCKLPHENEYMSLLYGYYATWCALTRGDIETAQTLCQTTLQQMVPAHHAMLYAPMVATFGVIARERGELAEAEQLLHQARAELHARNDYASELGLLWHQALLSQAQGKQQAAETQISVVLSAMREAGYGTTLLWQPQRFAEICEWAVACAVEPMYATWLLEHSLAAWSHTPALAAPDVVAAATLQSLTARQRQVLLLAAQGLSDQAIANTLIISASTVQNHMQSIYKKLAVTSRVGALRIVFETCDLRAQLSSVNN